MWWGCVVFLILGYILGMFVTAILSEGKMEDYRNIIRSYAEENRELKKLTDLGYELSELVGVNWYGAEVNKEIKNYQKQYEAVNVLSQPLRSDNNAKN